jgi:hypothetical protein
MTPSKSSSGNLLHKSPLNHPASLSLAQRVVLRVLTPPREMPYSVLCNVIAELPEDERMTQTQLDTALFELVKLGYASTLFEMGEVVYLLEDHPDKRDETQLRRI